MNDVASLAGPIMTAAHLGSPNAAAGSPVLSANGLPPIRYNFHAVLQGKDSSWLQLEVCREFQRNRCTRSADDCRYAHPGSNVEINAGRVTACYDSIKVSLAKSIIFFFYYKITFPLLWTMDKKMGRWSIFLCSPVLWQIRTLLFLSAV